MERDVIKTVSNKCFGTIDKCVSKLGRLREKDYRVIITKADLDKTDISQELIDEVTGLMKSFGIKHARYQRLSQRFLGIVSQDAIKHRQTNNS